MPTKFRLKTLACCLLCLGLPWHVYAESEAANLIDTPFEKLVETGVETATSLARQVSDAPSAVSIVTAEDIRAYGYRTLADVINSFPGLYTTNDRMYDYMGGRGFGNNNQYAGRIMLLIDGYATQDNVFSQIYLGNDGILDLDLIERVEYVPGTGGVTYGNNAMYGTLNIVTKKGADFNATRLSAEIGSLGAQRQRVTYGKHFDNGSDVLLSLSGFHAEGQKDIHFAEFDGLGNGLSTARAQDSEQNQRFFGKFSHENLMIELGNVRRKKDIPTALYSGTAPGLPFTVDDENTFLNARYDTDLSLDVKSSSRIYFGEYRNRNFFQYDGVFIPTGWTNSVLYRGAEHHGVWYGADQKWVSTAWTDHRLVLGVEGRVDQAQDYVRRYYDPQQQALPDHPMWTLRNQRTTYSAYIEDAITINGQWQLILGLRGDTTTDNFTASSPRLAAIYTPNTQQTFKLSSSSGFRFPNAYDLTYARHSGFSPMPEYVKATELAYQHQLAANTRISLTQYRYDASNARYFDDVSGSYITNGRTHTDGFESELESRFENNARLRASLALQHAVDTLGDHLANSPDVVAKIQYTFLLPGKSLRAGIEELYLGKRYTLDKTRELPGIPLTNLAFSTEHKFMGFSASFSIRNVFDLRYETPADLNWAVARNTLESDGRSYWLQLNYDF